MKDPFISLGEAAGMVAGKLADRGVRPVSVADWLQRKILTVGGSEVPSLFGVNPYQTPYELFSIKRGEYSPDFASADIGENSIVLPPTERGHEMELVAMRLLQRLRPKWKVVGNQIPGGRMFYDAKSRMSSTPDVYAVDPFRPGLGTVQVKSVDPDVFRRQWKTEAGDVEAPLSAAVQTVVDARLSGCSWGAVGVVVAGHTLELHLIEVPLHEGLFAKARELVNDFWRRVRDNDPYPADYARDAAAIAERYRSDNGMEIDLAGNNRAVELADQRESLKARERDGAEAAKARKAVDAELLMTLGEAAAGRLADGRVVTAKTTHYREKFTVTPASTRRNVEIRNADGSSSRTRHRGQPAADDFGGPF